MSLNAEPYEHLVESLGGMADAVLDEFRMGWQMQQTMAELSQKRIAQANNRLEAATVEGIGQHIASIDLDVYLANNAALPGCWGDKTFVKEFLKKNEECRVRTAKKAQIIVP